ncbi:MAG TPA: formate dehydrogenase [Ramlibacter sp.]|nr:formate dehydrogenase [Ramlibacter sp.]
MSQPTRPMSRRTLFAGAATVGAVAAGASLLPAAVRDSAQAPEAKPEPPARGGGYHLSAHVRKYFKTTQI